jgi:hypothetical protein
MTISELIKELEDIKELCGDLPVGCDSQKNGIQPIYTVDVWALNITGENEYTVVILNK